MSGGIAPGWYPDYEAPPGHQRYWNGERWTERRSGVSASATTPVETVEQVRRFAPWVLAAVAALVVISAAVLVVGDDHTASSNNGSSPPPAESTPGPPASEQTTPDEETSEETGPDRRTWQVDSVVDGRTLRLTNGAEVRLAGIAQSCGADGLAKLVVGQQVTLTRRGLDEDADGRLLRFMERDGTDVGKRLIQRGWATASDDPNPRRAIYRRVDERSPDVCD